MLNCIKRAQKIQAIFFLTFAWETLIKQQTSVGGCRPVFQSCWECRVMVRRPLEKTESDAVKGLFVTMRPALQHASCRWETTTRFRTTQKLYCSLQDWEPEEDMCEQGLEDDLVGKLLHLDCFSFQTVSLGPDWRSILGQCFLTDTLWPEMESWFCMDYENKIK